VAYEYGSSTVSPCSGNKPRCELWFEVPKNFASQFSHIVCVIQPPTIFGAPSAPIGIELFPSSPYLYVPTDFSGGYSGGLIANDIESYTFIQESPKESSSKRGYELTANAFTTAYVAIKTNPSELDGNYWNDECLDGGWVGNNDPGCRSKPNGVRAIEHQGWVFTGQALVGYNKKNEVKEYLWLYSKNTDADGKVSLRQDNSAGKVVSVFGFKSVFAENVKITEFASIDSSLFTCTLQPLSRHSSFQ